MGGKHLHIPSKGSHTASLQCSTTAHFTWSLQTKSSNWKITAGTQHTELQVQEMLGDPELLLASRKNMFKTKSLPQQENRKLEN